MITAQMATLPEREKHLYKVVNSILPQVDRLYIMLNGHKRIPKLEHLKHPKDKITFVKLDNSMGDLAKFHDIEKRKGYIFTTDDDLVYPKGYFNQYIEKIDMYECPVTVHGAIKYPHKVESFYQSTILASEGESYRFHWNREVKEDVIVDVGGTGCMGWHSDHLKVSYAKIQEEMKYLCNIFDCEQSDLINMGDIWFKWFCLRQKVNIVVIEHKRWFFEMIKYDDTIFDKFVNQGKYKDYFQARLWNFIRGK